MSWRYLQEQAEEYWEASSLDGAPSALLKLIPIAEGSCCSGSEMESCPDSPSGMMSKHSMGDNGEEGSMLSVADFPARTSQVPTQTEKESTAKDPVFGQSLPGSFVRYDHDSHLWRTHQTSLVEGLDVFLETWPRWGSMQDGECWELQTLERHISEKESGLLLPTARCPGKTGGGGGLCGGSGAKEKIESMDYSQEQKRILLGLSLSPVWMEWFMGWPKEWTDIRPLEMDRFQSWLQAHGRS